MTGLDPVIHAVGSLSAPQAPARQPAKILAQHPTLVFLIRSHLDRPETLNAIAPPFDDPTERRARHLRQCQRLAELGMDLAEAAHREAKRDLEPPAPRRPPPFPASAIVPGLPVPPTGRDATFGVLFTKVSRSVRQAILLEARIAARAYDAPPAAPARQTANAAHLAPNRPAAAAGTSAAPRPDRPEQVEDDVAADAHRSIPECLAIISRDLEEAIDAGGPALSSAAPTPCNSPVSPPRPHYRPLTAQERSAELAQRSRPPPTDTPPKAASRHRTSP